MSRPTDWWVLDLSRDPTPGEPYRVRALARRVQRVADDARQAEREVRSLAGDGAVVSWLGLAGDVFRGALDDFPSQLAKLEDSYDRCADALTAYAGELESAQDQADRALAQGREARAEVEALQGQLSAARDAASTASSTAEALTRPLDAGATPPDPEQVRAATRNAQAASSRVSALSGSLGGAQSRLEAAKRLARQAEDLRNDAGDRARDRLHDASDAGIEPNSWWEDFKSTAAKVWDVTIAVAKVVVAVLGIVVLVIGGPLAWVVVGLSVLILADALMKVASGEGSWLDVAVAALGLIPGVKGLTSAKALKDGFVAARGAATGVRGVTAGLRGSGGVLGRSSADLLTNGARGLRMVWEGRGVLPVLARQAPSAAAARLANAASALRAGTPGALRGFGVGFSDGSGVLGRLKTGFGSGAEGFRDGVQTFVATTPEGAVHAARSFQGSLPYLGVDRWTGTVLESGRRLEAAGPGYGGFTVPEGTFARLDNDASAFNEALQIGSRNGEYRPYAVEFRVVNDVPAAQGVARANPQYGAGGGEQLFVPDFAHRVDAGDIVAVAPDGSLLPTSLDDAGRLVVDVGEGGATVLKNLDQRPEVYSPKDIDDVVLGAGHVKDAIARPFGIASRAARLVP